MAVKKATRSPDHIADFIFHAYFGIDWDVVWRAAKNRCPVLREQIALILAAEIDGPEL